MRALSFLFPTLTTVFFVVTSENTDGQWFQSQPLTWDPQCDKHSLETSQLHLEHVKQLQDWE